MPKSSKMGHSRRCTCAWFRRTRPQTRFTEDDLLVTSNPLQHWFAWWESRGAPCSMRSVARMAGSRSLAVILPLEFLPFGGAVAYLRWCACCCCLKLPALPVYLPVEFACGVQHLICLVGGHAVATALTPHCTQEALHCCQLLMCKHACMVCDCAVCCALCLQQQYISVCEVFGTDAILP